MENPSNLPPKVTLEDLLRLKRHERPGPEYWARFDGELRQRMLRKFVQPEPLAWRWSRALVARATPWMTAGATAGIVMAFALHNRIALPTAENTPAPHPTLVASIQTPAKMVQTTEAATSDTLSEPTTASAVENTVEDARTKYVVAVLAAPSQPANDHKVSATTTLPGEHADGVRYAANSLVEEALLSRTSGMAY
jgi:hypothetical protein